MNMTQKTNETIALIGALEDITERVLKLAKTHRNASQGQKRVLEAYALARKAQDQLTLAGADL
jgi:hypothetical protein